MLCSNVKLWVRSTSTVPSTPLLTAASGRMRSSWPPWRLPRAAQSTINSNRLTTATQARKTSGRSWAGLGWAATKPPA